MMGKDWTAEIFTVNVSVERFNKVDLNTLDRPVKNLFPKFELSTFATRLNLSGTCVSMNYFCPKKNIFKVVGISSSDELSS